MLVVDQTWGHLKNTFVTWLKKKKKKNYEKWAGKSHLNALWGEAEQPSSRLSSLQ